MLRGSISQSAACWMAAVLLLAFLHSCTEERERLENAALLQQDTVAFDHKGQFLSIVSSADWTISLEFGEGTDAWCSVTPVSGSGSGDVMLSCQQNRTEEARSLILVLSFSDGERIGLPLVQLPKERQPETPDGPDSWGLVSDPVQVWMELPEVVLKDGSAYVSHRTQVEGKDGRNYSFLYDAGNRIALWVAYPLYKGYTGSQKRTDKWGWDPKIPQKYQPNLSESWPTRGYDRGHQLPSGSRTAGRDMNEQTFYYTNMTAQHYALNQRVWMHTENKVRSYASVYDTLYVVTGPVLTTTEEPDLVYLKDNDGHQVALPKAYFKVLLGMKKNTDGTVTYRSAGFWFENRQYPDRQPEAGDLHTVAEIEEWTGIDFFTNLPDETEKSVEAQLDPSKWGF